MNIILFQPQIPQNTGNIVRTCLALNAVLTLVRPLGFSINSKKLKRAGLDYWDEVKIDIIDDLESFIDSQNKTPYFLSSKVTTPYTCAKFTHDPLLIFGSETEGLPEHIMKKYANHFYTIPMANNARCLNLSNCVAVVGFASLAQNSNT